MRAFCLLGHGAWFLTSCAVRRLPVELFNKLETAAQAHPPRRVVNPSKRYNLGYDIFDDDGGVLVPDEDDVGERSGPGRWRQGV